MEEFIKYVNKTTLGLLPLKQHRGFGYDYLEFAVDQLVTLNVNDVHITTFHVHALEIFNADGLLVSCILSGAGDELFKSIKIAVRHRPGVAQLPVSGVPVMTLGRWTYWKGYLRFHLSGMWLELGTPEAVELWRSSLNT